VTILDEWTFEQTVSFISDGSLAWFTTKVTYTGDSWRQVVSFNGKEIPEW